MITYKYECYLEVAIDLYTAPEHKHCVVSSHVQLTFKDLKTLVIDTLQLQNKIDIISVIGALDYPMNMEENNNV